MSATMSRTVTIAVVLTAVCLASVAEIARGQIRLDPNHSGRRRGAILGGLAGAALGVAIGDKGDNETAGALIGGAAGAVAGGMIGNQRDVQRRGPAYGPIYSQTPNRPVYTPAPTYHPAPAYHPTPTHYPAPTPHPEPVYAPEPIDAPEPVYAPETVHAPPRSIGPSVLVPPTVNTTPNLTHAELIEMSVAGMSDAMIIRQIQRRGIAPRPTVAQMIQLYHQGVGESVLEATQQ